MSKPLPLYIVSREEQRRGDISGLLANRAIIEAHGLYALEWEIDPDSTYHVLELPEVRRYVTLLLDAWPEILRFGSGFVRGTLAIATGELYGYAGGKPLHTLSINLVRAMERAGLNTDFSEKHDNTESAE